MSITLDGKEVTVNELAVKITEASTNSKLRIIEKGNGEWVTLKQING